MNTLIADEPEASAPEAAVPPERRSFLEGLRETLQPNMLVKHMKGDIIIWLIVILLSLISILAVYSSTSTLAYKVQGGNTEFYVTRHILFIFFGFAIIYLCHRFDYRYYALLSRLMLYASPVLLILTYLVGENINGADRWLRVPGIGLTFQTSDFAKLALITFVARMLARKQDVIKSWKQATLPIMGWVVAICALIFPSNFSTAAVLYLTSVAIMFIGRISARHLAIISLSMIVGAAGFVYAGYHISRSTGVKIARVNTWVKRIEAFTGHTEESDQALKAKIAIAGGGFFGKGPGKSIQKNFLPNPFSDYIFAVIVEEYGLAMGAFMLLLYLMLLYRGILIVIKSPKAFGALLAVGLCFMLSLQAIINMCVTTGIAPVTGLSLPLVSMGGTSMLFTCLAFGIILSVSSNTEPEDEFEPKLIKKVKAA